MPNTENTTTTAATDVLPTVRCVLCEDECAENLLGGGVCWPRCCLLDEAPMDAARGVPGTAPTYRLLERGEQIERGDEVLGDDTVTWQPIVGWETRLTWDGHLMPMRRRIDGVAPSPEPRPLGCALAMRVMQSDLYPQLDEAERADCDELVRRNVEWFKRDSTRGVVGTLPEKAG